MVNLLSAEQAPAARWFAERGRPLEHQMDLVDYNRGDDGIAVLKGSIGHLGCTTDAIHPAGDHSIVVGRVDRIVYENLEAPPLVYLDHRLGPL